MQFHLCVIYLAAGLDKAMGRQWWNGEAIWQTVSQPIFGTFELSRLARLSWIPRFAGWSTLVVEIGYVFFIWPRTHAQSVVHRDDRIAPGHWPVHGARLFLERDDSPDSLFLSDSRGTPGARRGMRRRRQVLAALLVVMGVAALDQEASGETGLSDDFAPLVRRLMARDQIPGVAVGVVERGHLTFARGFGYRDVDKHLPVTPDTLFSLGSCLKAFTATAIALLADEGRIALDTPVRTYLPDFSLQDPVASATLTPRDLLTHKSGLPRHDLFWYHAPFSRDELYGRLRFLEPSGPPARDGDTTA